MLPFLKPEKISSVIMSKRKPDGGAEVVGEMEPDGDASSSMLQSAAEDLIKAVHSKDASAVAAALEAAYSECSAPPMSSEPSDV